MTIEQLKELMKIMNRHKITEFNMKDGDFEIEMKSESEQAAAPAPAPIQMAPVPVAVAAPGVAPAPAPAPAAPAAAAPATAAAAPAPASAAPDESKLIPIKSPMPGTFYRAPGADKPPYAKVGDVIEAGQVVCMIEAMKLFNELESEVGGQIVKVLVENEQPVEYDQVLFLVEA